MHHGGSCHGRRRPQKAQEYEADVQLSTLQLSYQYLAAGTPSALATRSCRPGTRANRASGDGASTAGPKRAQCPERLRHASKTSNGAWGARRRRRSLEVIRESGWAQTSALVHRHCKRPASSRRWRFAWTRCKHVFANSIGRLGAKCPRRDAKPGSRPTPRCAAELSEPVRPITHTHAGAVERRVRC